jgi:hypothetical protein
MPLVNTLLCVNKNHQLRLEEIMSTTVRGQIVEVGRTPYGKVLQRVPVYGSNLHRVEFTSGGLLPKELRGSFTDTNALQKTVDKYLEFRKVRAEGKRRWWALKEVRDYQEQRRLERENNGSDSTSIK